MLMRVNLNNRIETLEKHMMTSSRKPKTNQKGIKTQQLTKPQKTFERMTHAFLSFSRRTQH